MFVAFYGDLVGLSSGQDFNTFPFYDLTNNADRVTLSNDLLNLFRFIFSKQ